MPRRDGSGPTGAGPMIGRGFRNRRRAFCLFDKRRNWNVILRREKRL